MLSKMKGSPGVTRRGAVRTEEVGVPLSHPRFVDGFLANHPELCTKRG